MRRLDPRDMKQLSALSQMREKQALAELARLAAKRRAEADAMAELRTTAPLAATPHEALAVEKWSLWREEEQRRCAGRIALLAAEYATSSVICGRTIAENAVVETLADTAKADARNLRDKRQARDHGGASHLLADDVGDQNILDVRADD